MLKKRMLCVLCFLLIFQSGMTAFADGAPGSLTLYVDTGNAGRLHLRSRPDSASESLGLYRNGTQVLVEGFANGGWAAVLVNGRRGYMNMNYLSGSASQAAAAGEILRSVCAGSVSITPVSGRQTAVRQQVSGSTVGAFKRMYVRTSCGSLHLRAYASQSAESLGLYSSGTPVYATDLGNGWSYVLAGGLYGCMMTQYLSPDPPYSCSSYEQVSAVSPVIYQYVVPARSSFSCGPQPTPIPSPQCGMFAIVRNPNSSFVYLRSSRDADRRDNILAQVPAGAEVTVLEQAQYWSRVRYHGMEGYMASRYLK